jgi:hypothetical protein
MDPGTWNDLDGEPKPWDCDGPWQAVGGDHCVSRRRERGSIERAQGLGADAASREKERDGPTGERGTVQPGQPVQPVLPVLRSSGGRERDGTKGPPSYYHPRIANFGKTTSP